MDAPSDQYHQILKDAAQAYLDSGIEAGRLVLAPIAGEIWTESISGPTVLKTERVRKTRGGGTRTSTPEQSAAAFVRDHFGCRYCGAEIIPKPVAVLMSSLYPREIAFHKNYKKGHIHPLFWTRVAELDHFLPGSRSQDRDDPENHVTSCVVCNVKKRDRTLSELGWTLRDIEASDWDGMVSLYGRLWVAMERPTGMPHSDWLRQFRASRKKNR